MSGIGEPQLIEGSDRRKIKELIPIQCIQQDCDQASEILISVPASTLDFDSNQRSRAIIILCPKHAKLRQWTSKGQVQFTILAKEVSKELRPIKLQEKSVQFNKASQILDSKSCCMRENLKMVNLKTIFTFLSLISNDNDKLKQLVNSLMIQQYQQLHNEYLKALKNGNIISILRLTHLLKTMKKNTYKQYENIIETTQFLSGASMVNNKGPSLSAISFVKVMIPEEGN